jgi:hypothetical protein
MSIILQCYVQTLSFKVGLQVVHKSLNDERSRHFDGTFFSSQCIMNILFNFVKWDNMRTAFLVLESFHPHYGPGVDSASNRNEYKVFSCGVKSGRRVSLTTLPPSVSRLSRENVGASMSHNLMGLHGLL